MLKANLPVLTADVVTFSNSPVSGTRKLRNSSGVAARLPRSRPTPTPDLKADNLGYSVVYTRLVRLSDISWIGGVQGFLTMASGVLAGALFDQYGHWVCD